MRRALRITCAVAALCFGLWVFLREVHNHYPIQHWLFWSYAKVWLWMVLFSTAIVTSGIAILERLLPPAFPLRERLVFAVPVGTLVFFGGMFAGGLLGVYGAPFSIALPLIIVAASARPAVRRLWPAIERLRRLRRRASRRPWWFWPVLLFGVAGVGLTYFAILSPDNAAFDSRFYHLGLAQQYATERAMQRSPVGWLPAAVPHLASLLYTWCLTLPGFDIFDRVICAAHLEFVLFVCTLAQIGVLVRWLAPGTRASLAWVAIYLFPGILIYDGLLSIAADHIAALFAIPAFLALRRAYRDLNPTYAALLATMIAGALLTKYQGMYILAFPALALALRAGWLSFRNKTLRPARGLAIALATGVVLTAPHWLKNALWYGDPLFPYLHRYFEPTAWAPESGELFDQWNRWQHAIWTLPRKAGFLDKLWETLDVMAFFSLEHHTWKNFHGQVPVFGSLFQLAHVAAAVLAKDQAHVGVVDRHLRGDRRVDLDDVPGPVPPGDPALDGRRRRRDHRAGVARRMADQSAADLDDRRPGRVGRRRLLHPGSCHDQ